jgi:pyrroloquinoline quinone (PQQ) biosynthesis protein C
MTAKGLIEAIRRELGDVEREIREHPYLSALEAGQVRREALRLFAGEQYHIIRSDLRSVALLVNRFGTTESGPYFQMVLGGETAALEALMALASALGLDAILLERYEPAAGALAYSAFMAWLALYGSDAEVAAGFLVNFAAWGDNCGRMSRALQSRYGFGAEATRFLDLFASAPPEAEAAALAVVERGLAIGVEPRLVTRSARLLQSYEKLFWDTLGALSGVRPTPG